MRRASIILLSIGIVGLPAAAARAQEPTGELEIAGTSNVTAFTCVETDIRTRLLSGRGFADQILAGQAPVDGVVLVFPVSPIDCGNGRMNKDLRKALKAAEYGTITYELTASDVGRAAAAGATPVEVEGRLTIAGTTRSLPMQVTVSKDEDGGLRVAGGQAIRMTDFGIDPPSPMLGLVKVKDEVRVKFDVVLRPATVALLQLAERR